MTDLSVYNKPTEQEVHTYIEEHTFILKSTQMSHRKPHVQVKRLKWHLQKVSLENPSKYDNNNNLSFIVYLINSSKLELLRLSEAPGQTGH